MSLSAEFRTPGVRHRPLQIVHGFDRWLGPAAADEPDLAAIDRGLARLRELGAGGIVANVGSREYLRSDRQWEIIRYGLDRARDLGLVIWLYDEDGYPSGAAGGLVLEGLPELEALAIGCESREVSGPAEVKIAPPACSLGFVGAWAVQDAVVSDLVEWVDRSGLLTGRLGTGAWQVLYCFLKAAYEGTHAEKNVHASRRYINVLEPRAVRRFIEVTHEAYRRELGPSLGGAAAFFTDEPSLMSSYVWPLPPGIEGKVRVQDSLRFSDRHPMVAWSRSFPGEFRRRKGYDIVDRLPDLFLDRGLSSREVREHYREVVGEVFAETYFGLIGDWCASHGLDSSGHVLVEEHLLWHAAFLGDLFALMRRMSLPGIDLLDSDPVRVLAGDGFMVAKQVSSAAHLAGRRRVMSETSDWIQGTEGRRASPEEVRGTLNLLYLLGVNVIASYYRWEETGSEYRQFADHAGRLSSMLTSGRHDASVAVLYPIRSVWGRYLPSAEPPLPGGQPPEIRAVVGGWTDACRILLTRQVDFDCIDERALAEGTIDGGALHAGDEAYAVIVIPPADRLSDRSLDALRRFAETGGRLVVVRDPILAALPIGGSGWPGALAVAGIAGLGELVGEVIRPTVRLDEPCPHLLCSRHLVPGGTCVFVINNAPQGIEVVLRFDDDGSCRVWDPATGDISDAGPYRRGEPLALSFGPFSAWFVVFSGT